MTKEAIVNYLLNGLNKSQVRAVTVVAYRAFNLGFFLWAVGALAVFRLGEGFAYAAEVNQVQEKMQQVEESVLLSRLAFLQARAFDLRVLQCEAIAEKRSPQVYTIQLREIMRDHAELTKDPLVLPTCQELM